MGCASCALESPRGSFDGAIEAIERQTGVRLAKRQVEELAGLAAMDFEEFYETRRPARSKRGDLLVLPADGKGIVMRPDALRTRAPARPRAGPAPKPRLSGEQQNRKRMAEIGAVYDAKPAPRTPADILTSPAPQGYEPAPGPAARNKWLTASIVQSPRRGDRSDLRRGRTARPQTPPHLGRAGGRRQPPDRTDQVRGPQTRSQGHDHRRRRARPGIRPVGNNGTRSAAKPPSSQAAGGAKRRDPAPSRAFCPA
jgi:hypothetical protein